MPHVPVKSHTQCHARSGNGGVSELGVPGWGRDAPAASSGDLPSLAWSMQNNWCFSITCQKLECLHCFFLLSTER